MVLSIGCPVILKESLNGVLTSSVCWYATLDFFSGLANLFSVLHLFLNICSSRLIYITDLQCAFTCSEHADFRFKETEGVGSLLCSVL